MMRDGGRLERLPKDTLHHYEGPLHKKKARPEKAFAEINDHTRSHPALQFLRLYAHWTNLEKKTRFAGADRAEFCRGLKRMTEAQGAVCNGAKNFATRVMAS